MTRLKISVLMPVYNAEKYLREAIDSILNQTFRDFEFIIINDASTDNSKNIILSYDDKRIRYFENNKNLGVSRSLNKGLKFAKSNLVARMDADDISSFKRLELQYEEMNRDKEITVLASNFDVVDERGHFLYRENYAQSSEEIYYILRFRDCLGHPTVMFRKSIILNVFHGYAINHEAEDYDLWLRISSRYKISKLNTSLLKLRTSRNSRMGSVGKKIDADAMYISKNNLESLISGKVNLDTIEIFGRNFATFRSSLSVKFSPKQIENARLSLEKINAQIITQQPQFLSVSILTKIMTQKYNKLKNDLYLAKLFNTKTGYILKLPFGILYLLKNYFHRLIN